MIIVTSAHVGKDNCKFPNIMNIKLKNAGANTEVVDHEKNHLWTCLYLGPGRFGRFSTEIIARIERGGKMPLRTLSLLLHYMNV